MYPSGFVDKTSGSRGQRPSSTGSTRSSGPPITDGTLKAMSMKWFGADYTTPAPASSTSARSARQSSEASDDQSTRDPALDHPRRWWWRPSSRPAAAARRRRRRLAAADPTKDKLAQVQARGTLVLFTDPAYPPQSMKVEGATRAANTKCAPNQLTGAGDGRLRRRDREARRRQARRRAVLRRRSRSTRSSPAAGATGSMSPGAPAR